MYIATVVSLLTLARYYSIRSVCKASPSRRLRHHFKNSPVSGYSAIYPLISPFVVAKSLISSLMKGRLAVESNQGPDGPCFDPKNEQLSAVSSGQLQYGPGYGPVHRLWWTATPALTTTTQQRLCSQDPATSLAEPIHCQRIHAQYIDLIYYWNVSFKQLRFTPINSSPPSRPSRLSW